MTIELRTDEDDGTLDEIVADNVWIHLEATDDCRWYLNIHEPGGRGRLLVQAYFGAINDRAKGYAMAEDFRDTYRADPPPAMPSDSLRARLTAFARDCTLNGDMTPAAERMLRQILEES